MSTTFITRPADRWDLIAQDIWQLPELAWAIAEENPLLSGLLTLDGGIQIKIPALESLRQPLVAANPARAENPSGFIAVPGSASPVPSPTPSPGPAIGFPIAIAQGGTEAITSQQALINLGAIAIASKGVPGGVAPLDIGALVPTANLPAFQAPIAFPLPVNQGGTGATTANQARTNLGAIALTDLPAFQAPLNFPLAIALGGTGVGVSTLVDLRTALGVPASSSIGQAGGIAPLNAQSVLPIANVPLNIFFPFTAGASFSGGVSPAPGTTLVQAGVDAGAQPRYWLVNASAPANSRIKSITVGNNGNIQIRHHNDNLSDGNVLEHTSSGNTLTNGTFRCGSGSSNFTGATFVPGALFYRSDISMLVYSDGTNWRRMDTNAIV